MSTEIETLRQRLKETEALAESRLKELVDERVTRAAAETQRDAAQSELAGIRKHESSSAASQLSQIEYLVQPARGERLVEAVKKRMQANGWAHGVRVDQHEKLKFDYTQAQTQLEQVRKLIGAEPGLQTAMTLEKRLRAVRAPIYAVTLLDGTSFTLEHGKVLSVSDYGTRGQLTLELVDGVKVTAKVPESERPWLLRWCDAQSGWARYKKLKAERASAPAANAASDSDKAKLATYRAAWDAHTDSQHLHGVRAVYNLGSRTATPTLTVDPAAFAATFHDAVQESLCVVEKVKFELLPVATRDGLRLAASKALRQLLPTVQLEVARKEASIFGTAMFDALKGQLVTVQLCEPKFPSFEVRPYFGGSKPGGIIYVLPRVPAAPASTISPSQIAGFRRFSPALAPEQRYVTSRPEDVGRGEVAVRWFEEKLHADNFAAYCRTMAPAAATQEIRRQRDLLGQKAPGSATRNNDQPWCVVDLRPRFVAKVPRDVTDRDRVVAQGLAYSSALEYARLRNDGVKVYRGRGRPAVTGHWCVVDTEEARVPVPTHGPRYETRFYGPFTAQLRADLDRGVLKAVAWFRDAHVAQRELERLQRGLTLPRNYSSRRLAGESFVIVDTAPTPSRTPAGR